MDSQNHVINLSEVIYKYEIKQIIFHVCKPLTIGNVFFCFTGKNFKPPDEVKSNKPVYEYNFFWLREVSRKMLKILPGAIDNVKTLSNKCSKNITDGWYSEVQKRLIASYEHKDFYLRIKQSSVFGDYYICLYIRNLNVHPVVESDFQFTIPAARALINRLPVALNTPTINNVGLKNLKQFYLTVQHRI